MGEVVPLFPVQVPSTPSQEKLEYFKAKLEQGVVFIMLNAAAKGVRVPPGFAGNPMLGLNFSYSYGLTDFGFDEQGVSATLSFNEGYFYCEVPWGSVYRIEDRLWMDDLP